MSRSKPALRVLLLACVCGWPLSAAAQSAATVDTVIVTARPDPLDPPVVAQARRRLSETPGAVAVISAESYGRRYAPNLADVLRDAPGVYAQKKWGDDIRLSIRGSGIGNSSHNRGVLLAQDGVPFNEADGFGDFQQIDPLIARYTEVWKGGNALRFGGALLGGAVNLVTPTGRTAEAADRLRLDVGSYGVVRGHAEVARSNDDWDVFAAVTAGAADGWRDQSAGNSQHLSLNIGRTFAEDREVRLVISAHNIAQEIPGSVTLAQALNAPTNAAAANLANEYQRNMKSLRTTVQTRWRLSPQTVFEGGAYLTVKDLDHPIFQVVDQNSLNLGAFGRLNWDGEIAGHKADGLVGAWLRAGRMDARQWVNLKSSRGALTAYSDQNARAADLFGEGRLFVTDDVAVTAGGSFGWTDRRYFDRFGTAGHKEADYSWFAPRLGLLWQAPDGAQVFANLTRSVEPPNFSALAQTGPFPGFTPLKPQDAWTAEVGARGRRGPLIWDVALYRAQLKDELLTFLVDPRVPEIPAATFNAGPTIHQGLEAGLDWALTPRLRWRQTYSWSDFRFDGDRSYGDGRLPVVPKHLYRSELKYEAASGWYVAPSVEWAPRGPWVDYANTLKAPGYTVWSLGAGARINDKTKLFIEARNLADKRYISNVSAVTRATAAGVSTAAFYPGEGRAVYGGVIWDF